MPQQVLTFGAVPYASPYYVIGQEECKNLYMEPAITPTSKFSHYYVSVPGLKTFRAKENNSSCRGLHRTSDSRLLGVWGSSVYEISQTGARTLRGTIGTVQGTVSLADNTRQVLLVDGEFGYILDLATNVFSKIDPNTFPNGATHCTNIDTYFIVNEPRSIRYNWSNLNDGLTWNPLNFATKEGQPDSIVAIKELSNQLWVFGTYSTEVHYDTGDTATQVWQRYEGAVIDIGCAAKFSVQRVEGNIFWLGSDKAGNVAIWSNNGLIPVKISTRGIEQLIHYYVSSPEKAIGYTYAQAGHVFYVLNFIEGNLTVVYDLTTKTWHTRTCLDTFGSEIAWRATYSTYIWDKNLFGDHQIDIIYEADVDYFKNDIPEQFGRQEIKRVLTTPIIQINQKRVRHNALQVIFEQGQGITVGFGENPKVILYTSDDSGHSWHNQRIADIGAQGNYDYRSRFLCLGHSRNRVYKIIVTDPIRVILGGLALDYQELAF